MNKKTKQSRPCAALMSARAMWSTLLLLLMILTATTAMAQTNTVSRTRNGAVTYHATLKAAINGGLMSGDVLTLLADITIDEDVDFDSHSITLDLNGHSLNGEFTDYEMVYDEQSGVWRQDLTKPYKEYYNLYTQGSLTIKDGTISARVNNSGVGSTKTLTLNNTTINGSEFQWMTNGGVELQSSTIELKARNGYGSLGLEKISIDASSLVRVTGFNHFGAYGNVPGGLKQIVHTTLPEGYMFKQMFSDRNLTIVKKNDPDVGDSMKGITLEFRGDATPSECSDYKYMAVNKNNETVMWTDYDYCCKLCFAPNVTHSIRWNSEDNDYYCPHFIIYDDETYYDLLKNVVQDLNFTFNATQASYTREMKNKWGALVLPVNVACQSNKYKFYTLSAVSSSELTLSKVESETLTYGTPVLVLMSDAAKNATTGKYELQLTSANVIVNPAFNSSETVGGLTLTGSYNVTDLTNGYIINSDAFWNVASLKANDALWEDANTEEAKANRHVYNAPFRAYLAGSISNQAKMLTIGWYDDENTTAVETIDALTSGKAQYYDMNGRRINDLQEGINIVKRGNKSYKVIIK